MAATQKGFLESISPWPSRTSTPKPQGKDERPVTPGLEKSQGADHTITHHHRLSRKDYPPDCPTSNIRWFYAVDIPKRKPRPLDQPSKDAKPPPEPKKYAAFSPTDSRSIESAFRKLVETESSIQKGNNPGYFDGTKNTASSGISEIGSKKNTSINESEGREKGGPIKVPVNEDFLFDVDVEKRELAPTYWLGPIYNVRRGSWFYQEGSTLRPCDENLAVQLEEGFLRLTPWRNAPEPAPTVEAKLDSNQGNPNAVDGANESKPAADASSDDSDSKRKMESAAPQPIVTARFQLQTQRLFGQYMNSVVTYQDATVAWILTDDFLSRMSSTVYQRFAGGGHLGGTKVVRGFTEATKAKDSKLEKDSSSGKLDSSSPADKSKRRSISSSPIRKAEDNQEAKGNDPEEEPRILQLERQMSSFITSPEPEDPAREEEAVRKRDEDEIQEDYKDADGADQGREIEHLILVTHGIGQRLGLRMESINFIHDVNVLRKTLKSVYAKSPDLQALNSEVEKLPKNCRVQVLPVVWRHLLDFPKQSFKQNNKEQDLTDADAYGEDEKYPSLNDITVEGVPAIRNLITDLALDILLYQSAYREHIAGIVQRECNRIYDLFIQRNPNFHGKVSMIGHSLGSAIIFDILCRQKDDTHRAPTGLVRHKRRSQRLGSSVEESQRPELALNFDVEDFYCLGSPVGLYQMLKGRRVSGRKSADSMPAQSPLDPDALSDPFLGPSSSQANPANNSEILSITVSSPKCAQLFNIFHPADPIAYRLEPLISPAMSSLKPQPLPYTKRGIFGNTGQGITGIGTRVGQSVSGFWSSITTGVASSLLNRSLGLTPETQSLGAPKSPSPATTITATASNNAVRPTTSEGKEEGKNDPFTNLGSRQEQQQPTEHPRTLIDVEIETLYSGFQKQHRPSSSPTAHDDDAAIDSSSTSASTIEAGDSDSERARRRLRREEAKVRALNSNGRVDFSIQEGVFDISLIASIASHLSYWADEDVSHFLISQLLARQRVLTRR